MDISILLETTELFAFEMSRIVFEDYKVQRSEYLLDKTEFILNLCYISAAELALLRNNVKYQLNIISESYPIEITSEDALVSIAKTDTSLFQRCRAATHLPDAQRTRITDFLLFTGDSDKLEELWKKYSVRLVNDDEYGDMLNTLSAHYRIANPSNWIRPLNIVSNGVLFVQALLWRLKLDICIGSNNEAIMNHIRDSLKYTTQLLK